MEKKNFKTQILGDDIECKEFNDTTKTGTLWGIEVYRDDELLGSIMGATLPDETDSEDVDDFVEMLTDWINGEGF